MPAIYRLKNCAKCRGDLALDGDEWSCLQCGTCYYPNRPVIDLPQKEVESEPFFQATDCEARPRRVRRRTVPSINAAIKAKERSENRWWIKNQDIIDRLKQGYSAREISESIGIGQRQIRAVQEQLNDMALSRRFGRTRA